jgi:hypothetical protein
MSADESTIRALIEDIAEQEREGEREHPSTEELVAYQERTLPEAGADAIREHLALCPACAALVLDLEDFPEEDDEPMADEPRLTEAEHAEDLAELLAALPQGKAPAPAPGPRWLPLAAGILIGVLGVGLWLTGVPVPWAAPEPARLTAVMDLYPLEMENRAPDIAIVLYREDAGKPLLLQLNTLGLDSRDRFHLRIYSGGTLVTELHPVRLLSGGQIVLEVDPAIFSQEDVRMTLHKVGQPADAEPLATYEFQVLQP